MASTLAVVAEEPKVAATAPVPVPATAPTPAVRAGVPVPIEGQVSIVLTSGKCEADVIDSLVKALAMEGVNSPTVIKVGESPSLLPYAAKQLGGVVIAASVLPSPPTSSSAGQKAALEGALLQAGVSSTGSYIIPVIVEAGTLLEAKVLLSAASKTAAKSCSVCLQLQNNVLPAALAYDPPTLPPPAPVVTADTLNVGILLDDLRQSLAQHGAVGIFGLGRKFRIADDDGSGSIDFVEWTKMVAEHALHWTPAQLKVVFDFFDRDQSGTLTFTEFLKGVRGALNDRRKQLVLLAFEILDADKSGVIEVSDLEGKYDASKHPEVISGKKQPKEVLREFLDTFDSPSCKDGKVTTEEFCEYYATLSASIDEDDYFELMIRNAWHISGGEGWCANSSNRRVLATHVDGRQTVEEIKNDLGIAETDIEALIANLKAQGIDDVVSIGTSSGASYSTAAAAVAAAGGGASSSSSAAASTVKPAAGTAARTETSSFDTIRPSTAPAAANRQRRVGGGESSIVFG